jgi:hypothetical protein
VPETAVDVSPLLSAFEAHAADPDATLNVDRARVAIGRDDAVADAFGQLELACTSGAAVREPLEQTALAVLHAAIAAVPEQVLRRVAQLAAPHRARLAAADRIIDDAVRGAVEPGFGQLTAAAA